MYSSLRAVAYNFSQTPLERVALALAEMRPGTRVTRTLQFKAPAVARIELDVLRPDGQSTLTASWRP